MTVLDDIAALRARLEELERAEPTPAGETQRRRLLGRLGRARGDLTGDPQTSHPALLLPVRLETRFAWRDAGA